MTPPSPIGRRPPRRGTNKAPRVQLIAAVPRLSLGPGVIGIEVPLRLVNELNKHEDWRVRLRRSKSQKALVAAMLAGHRPKPSLPCVVEMTAYRPRFLDTDGSVSSCKWVRDAVAEWLGCNDGPNDPIEWVVSQEKRAPFTHGVRIVIREVAASAEGRKVS